jgi:hypothetical protein
MRLSVIMGLLLISLAFLGRGGSGWAASCILDPWSFEGAFKDDANTSIIANEYSPSK